MRVRMPYPFFSNCAVVPKLLSTFYRILFHRESEKLCKGKRYSLITRDTLFTVANRIIDRHKWWPEVEKVYYTMIRFEKEVSEATN